MVHCTRGAVYLATPGRDTAGERLRRATEVLARAGVKSPAREARRLLALAAFGEFFGPGERLPRAVRGRFSRLVEARARGVPVPVLEGRTGFLDFELKVWLGVLVPRPETEELAELARRLLQGLPPSPRALDLGTGTGLLAIAAAILGVKQVEALDNNPLAIAVAEKNIRLNNCMGRVRAREFDLLAGLPDMRRDLVILNLYKGLLEQLFARPDFWQARYYLVSGFLPGMEADLLAALPPGMHMVDRRGREQWRLWLLAKGKNER